MNYKHILFLSFLLMQTAPVLGMEAPDEGGFNVDNRFSRRRHQSTHEQNVRDPQVQEESKQNAQSLKNQIPFL